MSILNSTLSAAQLPAPILKSALKRKRAHDDSSSASHDNSLQPRESTKRTKLNFQDTVDYKFYDPSEDGEEGLEFVQHTVKRAIKDHTQGRDDEEYDSIKHLFLANPFSDDAPSISLLQKYLIALDNSAATLTRQHSGLVNAILKTQWLGKERAFVDTYVRFLSSLVSSRSSWMDAVLRMIVGNFSNTSASGAQPTANDQVDRELLRTRLHATLERLLSLVPSSSSNLAHILSVHFPAPTDSRRAHVEFVKNALRMTDYAIELKADVLDLITEQLLKIDVQVQVDVEELDDMVGDLLVQGALDDAKAFADDDMSDTESLSSEESLDPEEERMDALRGAVQKMDAIMDLLFAFYTPSFDKGSHLESRRLFNQMLSQFQKLILPTSHSRHTQFLLFHFAQKSPEMITMFVDACIKILMEKGRFSNVRDSAAAYLASFVARGSLVSPDTVAYVFDSLAAYSEQLRKAFEPGCRGPDRKRFPAYYATVQALIYIFCFRWRDLLNDPDDFEEDEEDFDAGDLTWAPGIKECLQQNFGSKLNPLKICVPEIVDQFARIAHHLQFMYIYQIIESNKRLRLTSGSSAAIAAARETALSRLHGERQYQLDAYFPFDPYLLPISKKWLANDYNEWKGVPGLHEPRVDEEAEDEDSSDDDEEETQTVVTEGTETPEEDEY